MFLWEQKPFLALNFRRNFLDVILLHRRETERYKKWCPQQHFGRFKTINTGADFTWPFFSDLYRVRGITLKCNSMKVTKWKTKPKSPGKELIRWYKVAQDNNLEFLEEREQWETVFYLSPWQRLKRLWQEMGKPALSYAEPGNINWYHLSKGQFGTKRQVLKMYLYTASLMWGIFFSKEWPKMHPETSVPRAGPAQAPWFATYTDGPTRGLETSGPRQPWEPHFSSISHVSILASFLF